MAVTLGVPADVLKMVKAQWDDSADELDGTWRRLHRASTDGFSPEVAAAVESFREPWVDEIKAVAGQAQDYSDEIIFFIASVFLIDVAQAERIRSTMPWAFHDAPISGPRP